jgi:hypothetical protein
LAPRKACHENAARIMQAALTVPTRHEPENAVERGALKPSTPVMQMATMLTAFIDGLGYELMMVRDLSREQGF